MQTTEQIINQYYTDRYSFMLECANNILKLIKRQDLKEKDDKIEMARAMKK